MTISELITQNKTTAFSFEVLPPLKGTGIDGLKKTIDRLADFNPQYINITNIARNMSIKTWATD